MNRRGFIGKAIVGCLLAAGLRFKPLEAVTSNKKDIFAELWNGVDLSNHSNTYKAWSRILKTTKWEPNLGKPIMGVHSKNILNLKHAPDFIKDTYGIPNN